jgi:hypothetical protein
VDKLEESSDRRQGRREKREFKGGKKKREGRRNGR